jgi:tyrosyl-tRNA synthetase
LQDNIKQYRSSAYYEEFYRAEWACGKDLNNIFTALAGMNVDERADIIRQVGEEILTEEELMELLGRKKSPVAYDGFEPSGKIHIAQGLLRAINVNKMTMAGCKFVMLVADWHAWLNNKLGGDLDKIHTTGDYFVEVWKASGMELENVKFVNCSTFVNDPEYWKKVVQVSRQTTIQRMLRCGQIMGREEKELQHTAQLLYPAMQCADIFHLGVDICQLGMDQRKVNILARELGPKLGWWKPVAVHHHMLMGLQVPTGEEGDKTDRTIRLKMSKSNPDSAIFMADSASEVERKMANAYCPAKQVNENPVLEYCKHIVFERQPELVIKRPEKFGGELRITGYEELAKNYSAGKLHPQDLKKAVAGALNELLEPVRKHFSRGKAQKLLEQVKSFDITR